MVQSKRLKLPTAIDFYVYEYLEERGIEINEQILVLLGCDRYGDRFD